MLGTKGILPADISKAVVIDASITGAEEFDIIIPKFSENSKIILTSVTIRELEKLQKIHDIKGNNARHVLALAAEKKGNFENVLIEETEEIPDDNIIKYCENNRDNIMLLTSDKTMALKARMYGVEVQYLKVRPRNGKYYQKNKKFNKFNPNLKTLYSAQKIGQQLMILEFNNAVRAICVFSNGKKYDDGVRALKVGDDVYICTQKESYINFGHYKIISMARTNNCELVYSQRIYKYTKLKFPKPSYDVFIRKFKMQHKV